MEETDQNQYSESVNQEFKKYLKDNVPLGLSLFGVAVVSLLLIIWSKIFPLLIIPVGILLTYLGVASYKAKKAFFSNFAKSLGLEYQIDSPILLGSYFKRGHARTISNFISGNYKGHPLEFFNYRYTTGSGKHKKTHSSTVVSIGFKFNTPEIILNSMSESFLIDTIFLGENHLNKAPTEGWFEKHFTTYTENKHEIEVLELLTPEVMEQIIALGPKYDYQFINNRLYIFEDGLLSTRSRILHLFDVGTHIVETFNPRLDRMQDDLSALREARNRQQ